MDYLSEQDTSIRSERMKPLATPTRITASAGLSNKGETHLYGYWLVLARIVWIALVALLLGLFVVSLPMYIAQLYTVSNGIWYVPWQLTPENAQALQHGGISLDIYAPCAIALSLTIMSVWVTVGGVIFWRKSDNWMALLVAFALIAWGASNTVGIVQFYPGNSAWQFAVQCLKFLFTTVLILFCYLFPDGRFVPGWTRWLAILAIMLEGGAQSFFPDSPLNPNNWPPPFGSLSFIILFVSIAGAQIYRYRRVSNSIQREQITWVVFALAIVYLGQVGDVVVEDLLKLHLPVLFSQFVSSQ